MISSYCMLSQNVQLEKKYLWIVKKWPMGSKMIVAATVLNLPYQGLKNSKTGIFCTTFSLESIRALFLDTVQGFPNSIKR